MQQLRKPVKFIVLLLSLVALVSLGLWGTNVSSVAQRNEQKQSPSYVLTSLSIAGGKPSALLNKNVTSSNQDFIITNLKIGGP